MDEPISVDIIATAAVTDHIGILLYPGVSQDGDGDTASVVLSPVCVLDTALSASAAVAALVDGAPCFRKFPIYQRKVTVLEKINIKENRQKANLPASPAIPTRP